MADLSKVLGGPWSPPPEKRVAPPEEQLIDAIRAAGLEPPDQVIMDGKLHRFKSGTKGSGNKGGDKPGWYLIFGDGVPAGRFGCWRMGFESPWRADVGRKLTATEEMQHARRIAEAKAIRDAELERQHEVASATVETIWASAQAASPEHPYLQRKGIGVHGARVTGDGRLVVPLYGQDGHLSSLQYIAHDGGKLYHPGGQTGGKFWMLGTMDEPGTLFVAEGFATAATIHETTNRPVIVAYSASNLVPVTGTLREMYGATQDIVIVADHDASGVGQRYAEQASAKFGARMVMPPLEGDANDYAQAGHDLASLLLPPADDWLIPADDFSAQPSPISWLVKRWVQDQALIMVHGPSGGGKTFVVLDWCLRMASGMSDWCGNKVKQGNVVYLAGEGHHGLRGRIAAWKHHHQAGHLSMWLSKDGCDLNTPTGYLKVVEQVRMLPENPKVIVVDTLHRFLAGDENSAQDAKTMLDACNSLMNEFGCSVILVHHTGVADEAQHRARGSSAWRGALDIEISIVPGTDKVPMQIVQRKSKDAEMAQTVHVELQQVTIPGWKDEDDQPVTSAVVIQAEAPANQKKDGKIDSHRKTFENAWWASGCEERNGQPYLSRSAMLDYLVQKMDVSEASAKVYIKPSASGKPIADLLLAEIIEAFEHGWVVVNEAQASSMMIRKSER
jgi:putative DNA primase/helicase